MSEAADAVWREGHLALLRQNPDLTNEAHHLCGCVTFFDTTRWSSKIVFACTEHKEYERV